MRRSVKRASARAELYRPTGRLVRAGFLLGWGLVGAYAANAVGVLGHHPSVFFRSGLYPAAIVVATGIVLGRAWAVREASGPWVAIGIGLMFWSVGYVVYPLVVAHQQPVPYPSLSDAFWLAFYPPVYVGLILLLRRQVRQLPASFWFQGLIAVLGLAAVSGAVLFDPIARSTGGAAGTLVTTFAYPIGDFMIMGLLLTMFAVTGWRPGRATVFLGLAFAVELPADILYLFQTANGTYSTAGLLDIAWPVATMLVAHAAWQPPSRRQPHHLGRALLVLPLGFSGIAIGLLIFGNFARLSDPAAVLASLTLLAALADATIGLLQTGLLRERAVRDSLTSLMNHGEFHEAIEREIELARRDQTPVSVILLDLDGFKQVNDRHGHAEGDRVLRETAEAIRRASRSSDVGGRLGGDEFGLLLPGADTDTALRVGARLKTAVRALGEDLSTSLGVAEWPLDGPTKEQVMFRADLALYSDRPREVERRRIEAATLATHPTGEDAADDVVERIVAVAREELQMDVAYLSQFTHGEQRYEAVAGEVESFCVKRGHGLALEQSYCQRVVDGSLPSVIPTHGPTSAWPSSPSPARPTSAPTWAFPSSSPTARCTAPSAV